MSENSSGEEFSAESSAQPSAQKSNNVIWIVLGCLGCGGLGVVFLGILMAIALPAFLNQADQARESEAKTYVGAMSRGQQAYFLENGTFAQSIEELQLGFSESTLYRYTLDVDPSGNSVLITAIPPEDPINHYVGAVFVVGDSPDTTTMVAQICESPEAFIAPPTVNAETGAIYCPPGSTPL